LSIDTHSETLTLEPNDTHRLANLCGPFDQNLKHIERRLGIEIRNRGNAFQLVGPEPEVVRAGRLLHRLYRETLGDLGLTPESVHLQLQEAGAEEAGRLRREEEAAQPVPATDDNGLPTLSSSGGVVPQESRTGDEAGDEDDPGLIRARRKTVKPRGPNQRSYVAAIREHDINFGVGPAT